MSKFNKLYLQAKPWGSSLKDNNYELLIVSNFTLYGTLKKGNKPDFHNSMNADNARELYNVLYLNLEIY